MFPFSMVCSIDGWLGCARFGNVGNASPSLASRRFWRLSSRTCGPTARATRRATRRRNEGRTRRADEEAELLERVASLAHGEGLVAGDRVRDRELVLGVVVGKHERVAGGALLVRAGPLGAGDGHDGGDHEHRASHGSGGGARGVGACGRDPMPKGCPNRIQEGGKHHWFFRSVGECFPRNLKSHFDAIWGVLYRPSLF